jgi:hypothetical protein
MEDDLGTFHHEDDALDREINVLAGCASYLTTDNPSFALVPHQRCDFVHVGVIWCGHPH